MTATGTRVMVVMTNAVPPFWWGVRRGVVPLLFLRVLMLLLLLLLININKFPSSGASDRGDDKLCTRCVVLLKHLVLPFCCRGGEAGGRRFS